MGLAPIYLLTGTETIEVFAILALALGFAGAALLILFAKKKV